MGTLVHTPLPPRPSPTPHWAGDQGPLLCPASPHWLESAGDQSTRGCRRFSVAVVWGGVNHRQSSLPCFHCSPAFPLAGTHTFPARLPFCTCVLSYWTLPSSRWSGRPWAQACWWPLVVTAAAGGRDSRGLSGGSTWTGMQGGPSSSSPSQPWRAPPLQTPLE